MKDEFDNVDKKFNEIVSNILKEERLKKGYSLEYVANKMNNSITRQALYKYEKNTARMKIKTFKELCTVLSLEPNAVINTAANYLAKNITPNSNKKSSDDRLKDLSTKLNSENKDILIKIAESLSKDK